MKKTRDGRRRFSQEFKIAAVRRVMKGEQIASVGRDLDIDFGVLWRWKKRVVEKGEASRQRMAEFERLVGRQQMEIDFLAEALRRVEERRQQKNNAGAVASSKR